MKQSLRYWIAYPFVLFLAFVIVEFWSMMRMLGIEDPSDPDDYAW